MPSAPRVPATLIVHLTAAVLLLTILWRPVHDSDLFWQLKLGELTLEQGWPPDREPFLAGRGDERLIPIAWLGQAVYAPLRWLGGYPLLHVADGLLWLGGLFAVGWSARRSGFGFLPTLVAVVLAHTVAYSSVSTRPQTFSLVGFGLLVALARSGWSELAKLASGLALMVVWQNFHPSAAVGGIWLAGVAAAAWGRVVLRGGRRPWAATGLVLFTPAVIAATPAGTELFQVSAYNAEVSRHLGISEWQPLWELEVFDRLEVWFGIAITFALLAGRGSRVAAENLVPALILMALTVAGYRFVLFWAAAAIPVWAAALSPASPDRPGPAPARLSRSGWLVAGLAWVLAVAIPTVKHPNHLADYVPFDAVNELRPSGVRGTLYCNTVWAGVLVDTGHPDWRVTHDGRYYLQSIDEWRLYQSASRGEVPVAELVRRFRPIAFVLRVGYDDGLILLLRIDPGWRELEPDRECRVFLPVNPPSAVASDPAGQ